MIPYREPWLKSCLSERVVRESVHVCVITFLQLVGSRVFHSARLGSARLESAELRCAVLCRFDSRQRSFNSRCVLALDTIK